MIDLAKPLRAAQARLDEAERELKSARATFDAADQAYATARRYRPGDVDRARQAWAMAGQDWLNALICRATAQDAVRVERRDTDRAADVALMATPKDQP